MRRNSYEMMIEGGRVNRGKLKKIRKRSAVRGQLGKWKRQAWNVLGGVGLIMMILVLGWLAMGGGG